jgi:hypothetical protein
MRPVSTLVLLGLLKAVASQQISDIVCRIIYHLLAVAYAHRFAQWQTTWDRKMLFTYFQPTPDPINFVSPGAIGSADIVVDDSSVYQTILGFGASLSAQWSISIKYLN